MHPDDPRAVQGDLITRILSPTSSCAPSSPLRTFRSLPSCAPPPWSRLHLVGSAFWAWTLAFPDIVTAPLAKSENALPSLLAGRGRDAAERAASRSWATYLWARKACLSIPPHISTVADMSSQQTSSTTSTSASNAITHSNTTRDNSTQAATLPIMIQGKRCDDRAKPRKTQAERERKGDQETGSSEIFRLDL